MKRMKRIGLIFALIAALLAFSACSKFEYDNSTIIAKVTSIDGQSVTFAVGESSIGGNMSLPEGMPDMGEMPDMGNMPDFGEMPDMGNMPDMGDMTLPEGMDGTEMPFTESGDTITLTLNEETVKTLSVDAIVQITFGDNGNVQSLTVISENMPDLGEMIPPDTDTSSDAEDSDS